jgi:hypothetical protein
MRKHQLILITKQIKNAIKDGGISYTNLGLGANNNALADDYAKHGRVRERSLRKGKPSFGVDYMMPTTHPPRHNK